MTCINSLFGIEGPSSGGGGKPTKRKQDLTLTCCDFTKKRGATSIDKVSLICRHAMLFVYSCKTMLETVFIIRPHHHNHHRLSHHERSPSPQLAIQPYEPSN